jgi:tetratricopeptide (TPR) repeat protein
MPYTNGMHVAIGLAIAVALTFPPAKGQRGGGGGGGGAAGGGMGAGAGRPTTPTTPGTNSPMTADLGSRAMYLSGKVQMDDGTPPPQSVTIERVCGGYRKAEAYTDSKGRFSFQFGQEQGITEDASYGDLNPSGQNPGAARSTSPAGTNSRPATAMISGNRLSGCEIAAVLAGYRSDSVSLSGRRTLDNPDVGTIILHRLSNVEGSSISVTTLQAPKDARKAYDKARDALRKDKPADAQKDLEKATSLYPQFAAAWYDLGVLQEKNNNTAEARKCYSQAIAADPKFVSPYLPLAVLSGADKNWQEMADTTARLIKLDPVDFPEAYYYNAAANYNLSKIDAAELSAREALKLDTAHRFPKVEHILGLILYQKNDYAGAAEQMRKYLIDAPNAPDAPQVKTQLAELERLAGDSKAKAEKQ